MASKNIPADEELDDTPRRGGPDEIDHGEGLPDEESREDDDADVERVPGGEKKEIQPTNPVTGDYEGSEPGEG